MITLFYFFLISLHLSHPLSLCVIVIIISLLTALFLFIQTSRWAAYAIALIFLGGIIIIFLYVSSLSLLIKKFSFSLNRTTILMIGVLAFVFFILDTPIGEFNGNRLRFFYRLDNVHLIIFIIRYLLFGLMLVTKFTESFKGAIIKAW